MAADSLQFHVIYPLSLTNTHSTFIQGTDITYFSLDDYMQFYN